MAIVDADLVFSDAQAITSVGATDSTNQIDCGIADANLGDGQLWVNVVVNTAFTSSGAGTLIVKLKDDADDTPSETLFLSQTYAKTALTKGAVLMCVPLPAEHERYLEMEYTVGTSAMTAGAVDAWLGLTPARSM